MKKLLVSLGFLVAFVLIHPVQAQAAVYIDFGYHNACGAYGVEGTNILTCKLQVHGGILSTPAEVKLTVTGGTATLGTDYNFLSPAADPGYPNRTTIVIPAGNYTTGSTVDVKFSITDDLINEGDESISMKLGSIVGGGGVVSTSYYGPDLGVYILDNEPYISVTDVGIYQNQVCNLIILAVIIYSMRILNIILTRVF